MEDTKQQPDNLSLGTNASPLEDAAGSNSAPAPFSGAPVGAVKPVLSSDQGGPVSPSSQGGPQALGDAPAANATDQDNHFVDSLDKNGSLKIPAEEAAKPFPEPRLAGEPSFAEASGGRPPAAELPVSAGAPESAAPPTVPEIPAAPPVPPAPELPAPEPRLAGEPAVLPAVPKEPEPGEVVESSYPTEVPPGVMPKKGTPVWIWILLIVIVVGGGGYTVYSLYFNKPAQVTTPSSQQISAGKESAATSTTTQKSTTAAITPAGEMQTADAERIRELTQIQDALKTYFDANGRYPISKDAAKLEDPQNPLTVLGMTEVPGDPVSPTRYYGYKSANGTTYELSAVFDNKQTENDVKISKGWLVTLTPDITLKSSATSTSGTSGSTSTTGTSTNK